MHAPIDQRRAIAIALGGIAGAALRWGVLTSLTATTRLPWPVLVLNVVGSVLLGVLLAEEWAHPRARLALHDGGAIGFCGGLTTFSTFSVEIVDLVRAGDTATAILYGAASVVLSLAGVVAGAAALRRVRAVTLPVEEAP